MKNKTGVYQLIILLKIKLKSAKCKTDRTIIHARKKKTKIIYSKSRKWKFKLPENDVEDENNLIIIEWRIVVCSYES